MEIHQLRYFVAVAQEGSFSRAAARVRVAQPSLSQQIQKLETELGQRLFDRMPRRVLLTDAGQGLLPYARRILNELSSAQHVMEDHGKAPAGKVRIGILPTIAPYIISDLLRRTAKEYAKVELALVEDVTAHLVQLVDAGDLDLAVISTCRAAAGLILERCAEEELLAALPLGHALAKRPFISWRDLRNESILLLHESHCLARDIQKWCAQHLLKQKRIGALQVETLLGHVSAGGGISLVPAMAARHPGRGVVFRPLRDTVPKREINILRNASHHQTRAARAVSEVARGLLCREARHGNEINTRMPR